MGMAVNNEAPNQLLQPADSALTAAQAQNKLCLYDSMRMAKCPFHPIRAGHVDMYVCGMTVYDYCHIGHARMLVAFDVIVRWLRQLGFVVNYVRNITDIDDKIIARAVQNNESITELTQRFIGIMQQDAATLGCAPPDHEPRATAHIAQMQGLIQTLLDTNYAYVANNQDVYYDVSRFANYGKLSGHDLEHMQAGARVVVDDDKRHPADFVLWKAAKAGEPQWAAEWGAGRPGWHIECSAMAMHYLGACFDIHGGGHDLQFPHHENEIAQSEAATGHEYAKNWMHVGFINVDGEKMSKSLGNFFSIQDVVAHYAPESVRYFILSSHYRSQINFSDQALNEAHASLSRLYQALKTAEQRLGAPLNVDARMSQKAFASQAGQTFMAAMNDDFNTPKALSVLFALARLINKADKAADAGMAQQAAQYLLALAAPLHLLTQSATAFLQHAASNNAQQITSEQVHAAIEQRAQAKADKDYALADQIRAKLQQQGIELEDSRSGTSWRRL